MENDKNISQFTNLYSLSKTLRFELRAVGKTEEYIQSRGLLTQDENRAESYKKVKKIIDKYHKEFIEKALTGITLSKLHDFESQYGKSKEERNEETFKKIKGELRKEIVAAFEKDETKEQFSNLFKKEFIKEDLLNWVDEENHDLVKEFEKFTTYFTGFHENRKNMYSSDEKSTAISYRIVHENLPKFIDNIRIYEMIRRYHKELDLSTILKEMEDVIQGQTLDEIFSLNFFNKVLSQNGIDFINVIIGGRSGKAGDKKIKGLNEYINLYNQQQTDKKKRIPKFKQLYKQILSDRNSLSWLPEVFETDAEILESINNFYLNLTELKDSITDEKDVNILNKMETILKSLPSYDDLSKIYLHNDTAITVISQTLFNDYGTLECALNYYYEKVVNPKWVMEYGKATESKREKLEKEKDKFIKSNYISIATLQASLDGYVKTLDKDLNVTSTLIADYFTKHFYAKDENGNETKNTLTYQISSGYSGLKDFLNTKNHDDYKLIQDKERVHQLKSFLDSIMNLLHFVKPLYLDRNASEEKNELFYAEFTPLYEELAKVIPLYNMVRNYLTKKPYSVEKFRLNFENSTLLDGWDVNKEKNNTGIILLKDGNYYLGIMDKQHNTVLENIPQATKQQDVFKKMNYKLLLGPNKMLPKVFFSETRKDEFEVPEEILNNYKKGTHKKGDSFSLSDCHKLIDLFKAAIQKHEDWKHFDFKFSSTQTYEDISGFYREVEQQGYKITFSDVPEDYINQLVRESKLYLFLIYNKDFSKYSKGKPNLHTLYWKSLFAPENLNNVIYKLNGQAEIFFRKNR